MILSDKTYNTLALIQRMIIPLIDFVTALWGAWNLPYAVQIIATLTAIQIVLGKFLQNCSKAYFSTGTVMFPKPEDGEDE